VEAKHFLKVVRFGYLPMLSFLLITLNYKVDVLMLEGASSITNVQLSYYTTGVSIAELAWFIPDVFKEVLFNKTAKKNNYKEISSILRVSNAVLIVIILAVIVLGRFMIRLFYGQVFAPAYEVTILLFLGIPAMSWFKIIYTLFNAQGRRKTSFSVLLASTLINILVNYFAIPHFGIYGAALASVLSYSVCGIVFIFLYGKISGEKVWSLFILRKGDIKTLLRG
jgi:O-antigen/teichoic acid export membrane protein